MNSENQRPQAAKPLHLLPRNKKLRQRFLFIIAAWLLLVLVLWFLCYNTIFREVKKSGGETLTLLGDHLVGNLNDDFSRRKVTTSALAGSVYVQDFLSEIDRVSFYEKAGAVSEIVRKTVFPQMGEDTVFAISASGSIYRFTGSLANKAIEQFHRDVLSGMALYSVTELDGASYFCNFSPVFRANSPVAESPVGYVVVLSNLEKMRRVLDTADTMEGIDTAVIFNNTILLSSNPALEGQEASVLWNLYGSVRISDVEGSNLQAAAAITREALYSGERLFFTVAGVTLALLVGIVFLLYRVLSAQVVNPTMAEAGTMRMGLLAVQIDAHFLVNTLDSVKGLADNGKLDEIKTTVRNLSAMLKSRHEAGAAFNVFEQMADLERYIEIMNIRHDNKYDVELDVDEDLSHCLMTGQILQPVVENALTHGLGNKTGDCRLTVTGSLRPDCILFEVADNGVGLPPAQLLALQDMLDTSDEWEGNVYQLKGVALVNIQRRIRAQYGEGYGLTVRATPNGGLTVAIRLPIIT